MKLIVKKIDKKVLIKRLHNNHDYVSIKNNNNNHD
jgi:hypothetical protein